MNTSTGPTAAVAPNVGPGLWPFPTGPTSAGALTGGASWQPMSVPPGVFIRAISMGTPQVGFAAGELGVVLKTTDGGTTWQTVLNQGFPYYWYGCKAFDANTVVVSGFQNQSGEGILRWSDTGGTSWGPIVSLPGPSAGVKWLDRIEFTDAMNGIVTAAWSGGAHHTTSGGRTAGDWIFSQPSANWLSGSFTFLPDQRLWLSGYDFVFSFDASATWTPFSGTSAIFDGPNSIHQNGIGYCGGGSISPTVAGWVYKTENGGNSWSTSPVLDMPCPARALLALDTQRAWAVGGNTYTSVGGIWGTTDGGSTWTLEQSTGNEMNDIDWIRIDPGNVDVFVAGYISQIWRATVAYPVDSGLIATSYGFCDSASSACGNVYNSGGCANMAGAGAVLGGLGTSSVGTDDLVLRAIQLPANKAGLLFMGPGQQEVVSGNGILCIAPGATGLRRFPAHNSGTSGVLTQGPGIVAYSNATFPAGSQIQIGQSWSFQAYYRDPSGPCGATYDFSNGFTVTFVP